MPIAVRHGIRMPQRGELFDARRGPASRLPAPSIHFGIALWPYDLLLRFAWDLPEHEHVWPNDWFDDVFERAAIRLRHNAPKLIHALAAMQPPLEALKDAALADELTREHVERTPLHVDLVLAYLAQILDDVATVIPHCYGADGRQLGDARAGISALARAPIADIDPTLAELLAPHGALPEAVATFARAPIETDREPPRSHTPDIYAIVNAPGFETALPKAAARALRESAAATVAAADQIDAQMPALCAWFDALLEHLLGVVCERTDEGEDLRQRWADPNWSTLQPMTFKDTQAALALTRALPAIAEGPFLVGSED